VTRAQAAQLVAMLAAAYAGSAAKVSDETAEVYERMLLDQDFQATQRAIARLIRSSKWLPTIAEILGATTALEQGAKRTGGEAWGDVTLAIRRTGYVGVPKFEDPIVAEIVTRWGWRALCCDGNDVADRARFIELYDQLAARQRDDVVSGIPLPKALGAPTTHPQLEERTDGR
jgi:hypothetical protein